ncbi:uncharacterized protein LOC8267174 [Ricinus communis]|uniref:Uncharacterized protein n=1 Tax=Ricinus communis TaxID=3988 RepID=B9SRZ0_RICCO|nr:uncharacterized protein LOC8267174 [Ricinus communis]EEF33671.1 conserved hypothetical protein [Ricinus communis]|eukprot:XP_002528759.1 uncharacterized protein LOC8267174 [Ricinus communis]
MPQVDLETLVSACAGVSCDNKIACETLAATTTITIIESNHNNVNNDETDPPEIPPDFPPESFWLSKDAEHDWFDRNAFIERKDSTKGNSHSTNLNPNINPNSNSQRFSNLKSKPSIIGLPKPQKSCFVDARRHCKPANTRLFPKRSGSVSKSDSSLIEPSSPKVSCMGRVRSKKDRNRRLKNQQQSGRSNETGGKRERPERKQRSGFFASFRAIFRATKKGKDSSQKGKDASQESSKKTTVKTSDIRDRLPMRERGASPIEPATGGIEPVGLGGMKRFASGRKSESWIEVA